MNNKKRISLALALLLGLYSLTACQKLEEKPAEEKSKKKNLMKLTKKKILKRKRKKKAKKLKESLKPQVQATAGILR